MNGLKVRFAYDDAKVSINERGRGVWLDLLHIFHLTRLTVNFTYIFTGRFEPTIGYNKIE